jgi:oligopeptide/dipeptide ABC transporter ATP-binding protein
VADEAAASLDILTQAQIVRLLKGLQDEMGMSCLFITHNLKLVRGIADRIAVMYLGKFVETGGVQDIFQAPAHPYTRALISSDPSVLPRAGNQPVILKGEMPSPLDMPPGCAFAARCPKAQASCSVEAPRLRRIDRHHWVACHRVE